jgi:release factor glutamine methyltransferase
MRPAEVVRRGEAYLRRHGVAPARAEAEQLMRHVLGVSRAEIFTRERGLSSQEARAYGRALCRRCAGEPLQHVTASVGFRGLTLDVRPGVFVPRPETEVTVEVALESIGPTAAPTVVDVGTGSGAIALAIARERPDARVWAIDLAPEAVALARANAHRLGLSVGMLQGNLLEPLPVRERGRVDLVVANPPYVPPERAAELPSEVRFDPPLALFGDPDTAGRICGAAAEVLRPGGWVVIEIEESTAAAVIDRARGVGFVDVSVRRDLAGRDRVVQGRRP